MKYRVVIKSLRHPHQRVVVTEQNTRANAETVLHRFRKLKWEERRPGVFSIGDVILVIEGSST